MPFDAMDKLPFFECDDRCFTRLRLIPQVWTTNPRRGGHVQGTGNRMTLEIRKDLRMHAYPEPRKNLATRKFKPTLQAPVRG